MRQHFKAMTKIAQMLLEKGAQLEIRRLTWDDARPCHLERCMVIT